MGDRDLPHEKLRLAIFWILFLLWPAERIAQHLWHPAWMSDAADIGAAVTALAFLLGKFLFQDTQRDVSRKQAEMEAVLSQIREGLTGAGVISRQGLKLIRRDGSDGGKGG